MVPLTTLMSRLAGCRRQSDMANDNYYSDREYGFRPRVVKEVSHTAWGGIAVLIEKLIKDDWFAAEYPEQCHDNGAIVGTDKAMMAQAIEGEIPGLEWPVNRLRVAC